MLRLYHLPLSPFCRKVRLVLAEKKVEVELALLPTVETNDRISSTDDLQGLVDFHSLRFRKTRWDQTPICPRDRCLPRRVHSPTESSLHLEKSALAQAPKKESLEERPEENSQMATSTSRDLPKTLQKKPPVRRRHGRCTNRTPENGNFFTEGR